MTQDADQSRITRRRLRSRWTAAAAVLPVTLVVASCGGGGGDPASVVKTFLTALANGDGTTACSQIDLGKANLSQSACQTRLTQESKSLPASAKQQINSLKTTVSSNNGTTAQVTAAAGGETGTFTLTKVGGKWLISGASQLGLGSGSSSTTPTPSTPSTPSTP